MKFKKYDSIENAYRQVFINKVADNAPKDMLFSVGEKAHGAHFDIYVSADEIKGAKRSSFVGLGGGFYNCDDVIEKYKEVLRAAFFTTKIFYNDLEYMVFKGELLGGHYPHPDVKVIPMQKCVQKGIWYTPENDFYGFDIALKLPDYEGTKYLGVDDVKMIYTIAGVPHAKELFRGTLKECLEYPNEFESTIYEQYCDGELPKIEDNICEGVVIRPVEPLFLPSGSRMIIKNKNSKWTEKANAKVKIPKAEVVLGHDANVILNDVSQFICENRLRNVISHVGEVKPKMFGYILGLLAQDVWKDYFLDEGEVIFKSLDKIEQKEIKKIVNRTASELIRKHIHNIIDGVF